MARRFDEVIREVNNSIVPVDSCVFFDDSIVFLFESTGRRFDEVIRDSIIRLFQSAFLLFSMIRFFFFEAMGRRFDDSEQI